MIEYAVLSSIPSNGLTIGEGISQGMGLRLLTDRPEFEKEVTKAPVLYRPKSFGAIDGIIFWIKDDQKDEEKQKKDGTNEKNEETNGKMTATEGKKKLLLFPLQITLAPASHSDSHEEFFQEYGQCIAALSEFDVELQFLWLTPEFRHRQDHPADPQRQWPQHLERYIALKDVKRELWEKYEEALKTLPPEEYARRKAAAGKAAPIKSHQSPT